MIEIYVRVMAAVVVGCEFPPVYLAIAQMFEKMSHNYSHYSNIYIYISLSFFCIPPSYDPFSPFIFILIFIYLFPPMLNFRKKSYHSGVDFLSKDDIPLLNLLSVSGLSVFPLFFFILLDLLKSAFSTYIHKHTYIYYLVTFFS